jgi:hypothetical protein
MEPRTKALVSGCAAFVLALVIILSATAFGFAPIGAGNLKPSSTGNLAIMLTDPPSIPEGVSAVYLTYDGLQIHAVGFPSGSGWVRLDTQGTIEALGLANLTETVTSTDVPSGAYDSVGFVISACRVDYQGKNYTATVNSANLQVPFVSELTVAPSGTSTALVDIHSTILNLGTKLSPQFLANAAAEAVEVPPGQVQPSSVGSMSSLKTTNWYSNFTQSYGTRLSIGPVSLTSHSFSLTLMNPTRSPVPIRLIIIAPASSATRISPTAASLADSTVLLVQADGSLQLLQLGKSGEVTSTAQNLFHSTAYELPSGASATFTYSGNLNLPAGPTISFGGHYSVVVIGNQMLAGTIASLG